MNGDNRVKISKARATMFEDSWVEMGDKGGGGCITHYNEQNCTGILQNT